MNSFYKTTGIVYGGDQFASWKGAGQDTCTDVAIAVDVPIAEITKITSQAAIVLQAIVTTAEIYTPFTVVPVPH